MLHLSLFTAAEVNRLLVVVLLLLLRRRLLVLLLLHTPVDTTKVTADRFLLRTTVVRGLLWVTTDTTSNADLQFLPRDNAIATTTDATTEVPTIFDAGEHQNYLHQSAAAEATAAAAEYRRSQDH